MWGEALNHERAARHIPQRLPEESPFSSLRHRTAAVAEAAASAADAVDAGARFPAKALEAARRERLLGSQVPASFGGDGASIAEISDMCYALGRACASAMIFAMHQIQVACLLRHGIGSRWHERLAPRSERAIAARLVDHGGQTGGDIRSSACAVEREAGRISLVRDGTVISYGAEADGIVTIARRAPDAAGPTRCCSRCSRRTTRSSRRSDGRRSACAAPAAPASSWTSRAPEQILPESYERIHAQTMMPVSHLLWSSVGPASPRQR